MNRPILPALLGALTLLLAQAGTGAADFKSNAYDYDLGPYRGSPGWSYNVAYGYGLPFGSAINSGFYVFPANWPYYPPYPPPLGYRFYRPVPVLEAVPAEAADRPAVISVHVPADAEVWFDGARTTLTGADRVFQSPPVSAGQNLFYVVRARWSENGKAVEQMQAVPVQGGDQVRVTFPKR